MNSDELVRVVICPSRKFNMVHNSAMPKITVCPETFEVTADGAPLVCEPATKVPLARNFFLF